MGCTALLLFVAKAIFNLKAATIPEEETFDVPSPELMSEASPVKQNQML